jgi:uncharacterized protein (TIGR04222 family)
VNPFDFTGPWFLAFYFVFAVGVHLAFKPLARAFAGGPPAGPSPLDLGHVDPYVVAYLRGQQNETARVAAMALLDRRLMVADGDSLLAVPDAAGQVRRPLERAVLEAFPTKAQAATIFENERFKTVVQGCEAQLVRLGLLVDAAGRGRVVAVRLALLALLAGVSVVKIQVALGRGRHNLGFLIFLTVVFCFAMLVRPAPARTPLGDSALETLRTAFSGLKDRAASIRPGGGTTELSLLLAVFGVGALAGAYKTMAESLFPAAMKRAAAGGDGGSGCGASTWGSSSSCGGSSCGGGGCGGGGCGGCGG